MTIAVGSTNPVKLNAVRLAAQGHWPGLVVIGFDVQSGVSEQPQSDEETRQGARTRAQAALAAGGAETKLGIGLEGGIHRFNGELWSTVWAAVVDKAGTYYESNGARFRLPNVIADKLAAGAEMGPAVSSLCAGDNIKQKQGAIGVITRNFVDRTTEYASIAKLALGLWYGREWEQDIRLQKQ